MSDKELDKLNQPEQKPELKPEPKVDVKLAAEPTASKPSPSVNVKPTTPVPEKKPEPVKPQEIKPQAPKPEPVKHQAPKPEAAKPQEPKQETPKQGLKIEIGGKGGVKLMNNQFAHNTPQDVNANVGSFGENVKDPSKEPQKPAGDELIVSDKSKKFENIKGKDVEIDFDKFKKKRKVFKQKEYKPGKTKFAVTLDTWLHNRRTCIKVWMVALAVMVVCMAVGLGLAIPSVINVKNVPNPYWSILHTDAVVGIVFGFIAGTLFLIPLIYLLITILVGINGIAQSRSFHYFLWGCLAISFICMIICCGLCGHVFDMANSFTNFPA